MLEDDNNPIHVGLYVMLFVIVMGFSLFIGGNFLDNFVYEITNVGISLDNVWSQNMMVTVNTWASWVYLIPSLLIIIVMVWGIKTVIKRHDYTAQDQQYMNYEE